MKAENTNAFANPSASEEEIAAYIENARQESKPLQLIRLLQERDPMYRGKATNQVMRIRGFVLASFKETGLPEEALPYLLEELESGKHAYPVAGAAIGLRGANPPLMQALPFLLKSINNIICDDDAMNFDSLKPQVSLENHTTAMQEIFKTFAWYGAYAKRYVGELEQFMSTENNYFNENTRAEIRNAIAAIASDTRKVTDDCCNLPTSNKKFSNRKKREKIFSQIQKLNLEDQDGNKIIYRDFFSDKPAVIAFFYTRCDNPNKCSLTITRLGQLQKLLKEKGISEQVKIAAVTYDPIHDSHSRLKNYCEARQMILNDDHRAFRIESGFEILQEYLESGVNYIGSMINKHTIELFILDKKGVPVESFTRIQWDNAELVGKINKQIKKQNNSVSTVKNIFQNGLSVLLSLVVAFFPKCPMCWAAYLSVTGITSLGSIPYSPWLLPVFVIIMGINLFSLWKGCKRRNGLLPFYLSVFGMICILTLGLLMHIKEGSIIGILFIITGSLLNSIPLKIYLKLKSGLFYWFRRSAFQN